MKQWQEILEMIVKRLQLSETYNKVMEEVKTFESNLDRMTSGLKEPQQIFHCKEDLEKHIQSLKVSNLPSLTQSTRAPITQPSNSIY